MQSILYRIANENPGSLRSLGADIGKRRELVLKFWPRSPARRYQRAALGGRSGATAQSSRRARAKSIVISTVIISQLTAAVSPFVGPKRVWRAASKMECAIDGSGSSWFWPGSLDRQSRMLETRHLAKPGKSESATGDYRAEPAFSTRDLMVIQMIFPVTRGSAEGRSILLTWFGYNLVVSGPSEIGAIRGRDVSESRLAAW